MLEIKENLKLSKQDIINIEENPSVAYNNHFYNFIFTDFNAINYNFLITLFYIFKEKRNMKIEIDTLYLTSLIDNKKLYSKKKIIKEFKSFADKASKIYIKTSFKEHTHYFGLFNHIYINDKEGTISISLNENVIKILNDIDLSYTKFFLKEFYSISGKYSKIIYLLLVSFKNYGYFQIEKNRFYEYLNLSKTYERQDNLDCRILNPAIKEIQEKSSFKELSIKKIKDENSRQISNFAFYFKKIT